MFDREFNNYSRLICAILPIVPLHLYFNGLYSLEYYEMLIVVFSFFQTFFFSIFSKLNADNTKEKSKFIRTTFIDLSILVFNFSLYYWVLYKITNGSAFHSNSVTFSTVGYGDIYVTSTTGRILVSFEILSYLIILIFIIGNYTKLNDEN